MTVATRCVVSPPTTNRSHTLQEDSMPVTKHEIISEMLKFADPEATPAQSADDNAGYSQEEIIKILDRSLAELPADSLVRTCADFSHLNVDCCETCHNNNPQFEMALIDVESGGNAWICCAVDMALNPIKHAKMQSSTEYKEIEWMFGPGDAD